MFRTALVASVAAVLALPAAAQAHVTLQPSSAAAGGYTRLDVRVPNERDDASTTKVELQFPAGFESASYEPVPGWTAEVGQGEGVEQITWTADDEDAAIPPGAFQDFGLSLKIPDTPGEQLTFKALQTYTGGEVVRWIGAEDSDNPAPIVTVTEAESGDHAGSHDGEAEATPVPAERTSAATTSDDGDTLAIVALIVGALGLIAGAAGFLTARRASGRSAGTP